MSLIGVYLNDHLALALAGRDLARRARGSAQDDRLRADLDRAAEEMDEERRLLLGAMEAAGVRPDPLKQAAGWAGEKLGRLKPNDRLRERSPLSTVVEVEGLLLLSEANANALRTLGELARQDDRLADLDVAAPLQRIEARRDALQRHRAHAAAAALAAREGG